MQNIAKAYSPSKNSNKMVGQRAGDNLRGNTQESMNQIMASSGGPDKSSSLIGRQVEAEAASVDSKIEKLQNLLKMAKGQ